MCGRSERGGVLMEESLKKEFMELMSYHIDKHDFRKMADENKILPRGNESVYALSLLLLERLDEISKVESSQVGIEIFRTLARKNKKERTIVYDNGNVILYGYEYNPRKNEFKRVIYAVERAFKHEFLSRAERITSRQGDRGLGQRNYVASQKEAHMVTERGAVAFSRHFKEINNMEGRIVWEKDKEDGTCELYKRDDLEIFTKEEFENLAISHYALRLFGKKVMMDIDAKYRESEKDNIRFFFEDIVALSVHREVETSLTAIASLSEKQLTDYQVFIEAMLTLHIAVLTCCEWQEKVWDTFVQTEIAGYGIGVLEIQEVARLFAGVGRYALTMAEYLEGMFEEYLIDTGEDATRRIIFVNNYVVENRHDQIREGAEA